MARSDTITRGGDRIRISPWRGSTTTASIIPTNATGAVAIDTIDRVIEEVSRRGYRVILTSALSPIERRPFDQRGFTVHDELHLLRLDLRQHRMTWAQPRRTLRSKRTLRAGRRGDMSEIIEVDRHAFDTTWQFDEVALRDAIAATPSTRFQVTRKSPIVGYHITGRSGSYGYLQRLAVHRSQQGRGLGRELLSDALGWLDNNGVHDVYVNTQLGNTAAITLYERTGFERQERRLTVLRYELPLH